MARCRIKAIVLLRTSFFVIALLLVACSQSSKEDDLIKFNCFTETEVNPRFYASFDSSRTKLIHYWEGKHILPARDFSDTASFIYLNDSILSLNDKRAQAVFAIYKPDTSLCVNSNYFSDLIELEVTDFQDYHTIGSVKKALLNKASNQKIIDLLFHSFVIRTWSHLSSKVCLINKSENKSEYQFASYTYVTTHEVCTNECNTYQNAFEVIIQNKSGIINLMPAELPKK